MATLLTTRKAHSATGLLLLGLLLLGPVSARAQSATTADVRGQVVEAGGGATIPGASVALHRATDSTLVTGAATEGEGRFLIENVPSGRYYLEVSYVGYETTTTDGLSVNDATVDVGEIALRQRTEQLENVEVSAERQYMQVEAGMTTYNPQNQPVVAGGSARSVLENIPSIHIDMEGNISYRGSQGVSIHLNGSATPLSGDALTSFLEGLSAGDIKRVEVIPNPSAKYDPEGTGGIINIVLADGAQAGWGGSLSASADTRGRVNGSGNVQYGNEAWMLYGTYSARYDQEEDTGFRYRENRYLDPTTYLEQDRREEEQGLSHTFNTNLEYAPSESDQLSLSAVASYRGDNGSQFVEYSEMNGAEELTRRYNRDTDTDQRDLSMEYELDYTHAWTPNEHEFSLEAEYESERENSEETYLQHLLPLDAPDADSLTDRQVVDEGTGEREASLEADYQRTLGEAMNLEAGYDGEFNWQNSDYDSRSLDSTGTMTPDVNESNTFSYAEQTHALYGTFEGELGDFSAQVGLRAETALTNFNQETLGENFDNNYFSLFPSAHLTYQPTRRNTIRASYSKRVRRPSTWHLNPFGSYDDPTFRRVGNPQLTPEYTHSFEIGYTRLGDSYTVSLTPYYRYTVDEISWNEELTEDGVTILTFENFSTENSYGAELVGSLTLDDMFKGNASFNAYKQVTDGSNLSSALSSNAIGFRTRGSVSADLGWGVSLQAAQFYQAPMDIPGGRRDARIWTNVALQKKLLGDRLTLNLRARDLFGARNEVTVRQSERYYRRYSRESDPRSVRLTLRYNFARSGGGDDDRGRGRRDWD